MTWLTLAESVLDSIPGGGAAWLTTLSSGGVLAWLLLVHLPSKDKREKEFHDKKDADMKALMDQHYAIMTETRKDFKESLNLVVEHCNDEISALRNDKK